MQAVDLHRHAGGKGNLPVAEFFRRFRNGGQLRGIQYAVFRDNPAVKMLLVVVE